MPGRKNKNRKSKGHNGTGISRENMYNEVDEFHEQRSQIMLKNAGVQDDSSDDDIDVDGGNAAVFDLNANGNISSSSSSSSDSDSDDEDDNRDILPNKYNKDRNDLPDDKAWGKKKDFYGEDDSDYAQNSEDEEMVVEEASRLQKEEFADIHENDYGLSDDSSSSEDDSDDDDDDSNSDLDDESAEKKKKNKKASKKKKSKKKKQRKKLPDEATALKEVNQTLDSIDFSSGNNNGVTTVEVIKNKKRNSNQNGNQVTKDKKMEIVLRDAPELAPLLEDFHSKSTELKELIEPLLAKIKREENEDGSIVTENGLSYLETKLHLILNYCINLGFYLVLKAAGRSVKDHPVVSHLVKLRLTMEKLRPLDAKLKYQIDKLLKIAATTSNAIDQHHRNAANSNNNISNVIHDEEDGLNFRPDMSNLVGPSGLNDDNVDISSSNGYNGNNNNNNNNNHVYQPPKRMAVQYYDDESAQAKAQRKDERRKRQLKNSRMISELANELSERPEELQEERTGDARLDRIEKERERFEEEYMTRLVVGKKLKKQRKAAERKKNMVGTTLGNFDDFDRIDELMNEETETEKMAKLEWDRRRALKAQLNQLEQEQRNMRKGNGRISGDADVEFRNPKDVARRAQQEMSRHSQKFAGAGFSANDEDDGMNTHFGMGGLGSFTGPSMGMGEEEDEVYKSAKRKRDEKRDAKEAMYGYTPTFDDDDEDEDDDGVRKANYQILKNKGLTAHKKKEYRNPRVRKRKQYERMSKRIKGQIRQVRTGETDRYGGEDTGIRSDLARSRKMN